MGLLHSLLGASGTNASDVPITDSGDNFTATDVEGALAELADAGGASSAAPIVKRKASDEVVNNSTTLQDDDELAVAVEANKTYVVQLHLGYKAGTTSHIKVGWSGPSGATLDWSAHQDAEGPPFASISETLRARGTAGVGERATWMTGVLVTSASAGTLQMRWAQESAVVEATTVLAGSYLMALEAAPLA